MTRPVLPVRPIRPIRPIRPEWPIRPVRPIRPEWPIRPVRPVRLPRSARSALLLLGTLVLAGCGEGRAGQPGPAPVGQPGPAPVALADTTFQRLVRTLSEPGGYFDTDNLISNETSYLHVLGPLAERGVTGGAYVGVGPDQNFSYMALVRPRIAFLVDIRRDNLVQHLLFKALFTLAPSRVEYLSLLHGRPLPGDPAPWHDATIEEIVAHVDGLPGDADAAALARRRVDSAVARTGVPLSDDEWRTLDRFHRTFMEEGLSLRFRSHGRAPRPYYPTLRQLVLERDLTGSRGSYLARRDDYLFLREMQEANRVVPVVGDLGGPHALRAVAEEIRRRGEVLSVLYTSNVEYYLFRDGGFGAFAESVASFSRDEGSIVVRSYFPGFYGVHPHAVPGYHSTQTLQTVDSFVEAAESGGWNGYLDLVTRHAIDPRAPTGSP